MILWTSIVQSKSGMFVFSCFSHIFKWIAFFRLNLHGCQHDKRNRCWMLNERNQKKTNAASEWNGNGRSCVYSLCSSVECAWLWVCIYLRYKCASQLVSRTHELYWYVWLVLATMRYILVFVLKQYCTDFSSYTDYSHKHRHTHTYTHLHSESASTDTIFHTSLFQSLVFSDSLYT